MNHTGFSSHSLILHSLQVLASTDATLLNRRQKAEHRKAYSLANQKLPQLGTGGIISTTALNNAPPTLFSGQSDQTTAT